MRKAGIFVNNQLAGVLIEKEKNRDYLFQYAAGYNGPPVSLTMPLKDRSYTFNTFPPFFDGLLPEGVMLEHLLKTRKIDRDDCFSQLVAVGADLVGHCTVKIWNENGEGEDDE